MNRQKQSNFYYLSDTWRIVYGDDTARVDVKGKTGWDIRENDLSENRERELKLAFDETYTR